MVKKVGTCALFAALSLASYADDGWVGNGGNPSLMKGKHPTIRMVDEAVRIHIGKEWTTVDCLFHFANSGPATKVKMGFPDEDSSREDDMPKSVFKRYSSWVDGHRVPCKFEGTNENGFWQTKSVAFKSGQTRTIRDRYRVATGSGFQGGHSYLRYADYILHTGNSWSGAIGSVVVEIDFDRSFLRPTNLAKVDDLTNKIHPKDGDINGAYLDRVDKVIAQNKKTVFWSGPGTPTLRNGVIRFSIKGLQPDKVDDISLSFAPFKTSFK